MESCLSKTVMDALIIWADIAVSLPGQKSLVEKEVWHKHHHIPSPAEISPHTLMENIKHSHVNQNQKLYNRDHMF